MDLALYRKYRPQTFKEVIGQEHVIKSLQGALKLGRVSHAYLFTGVRGTGKTTIARLLAKVLNCEKHKEGVILDCCNHCSICKEFNEGRSIDLIEIDAASNRGIDEIRNLKESVRFGPTVGRFKIYIIDEVHQLTKEAFNALLKTLEEPPEHAVFVLASTEPQKILDTIISRTQRFDFKRLSVDQILEKLNRIVKAEKIKIDREALRMIASSGDGSIRDAESNFAKVISFKSDNILPEDVQEILDLVPFKINQEFLNFLATSKKTEALQYINKLYESGVDLEQFAKSFIDYLRKVLIISLNPATKISFSNQFNQEQIQIMIAQARYLTADKIVRAVKIFIQAKEQMKVSPIPQLPLELAVIEFLRH